jgi:hypothetical protein
VPTNFSGTISRWRHPSMVSVCAAALAFLVAPWVMAQQPCNPVIDGTYCATAGIRSQPDPPSTGSRRDVGFSGISGAGFYEQPATLGAITFGSSGRCIGLVRRVNCRD